jgi:exodeoxyribonuclease V alpha subunit
MLAKVEKIIFRNEETGYTILSAKNGHACITITCTLPYTLKDGEEIEFEGKFLEHPRFGRQLKADYIRTKDPTTAQGIFAYLSSGIISGIGPATAERIVRKFGEQTLEILDDDPRKLLEIKGIGDKKLIRISGSWREKRLGAKIIAELCHFGLSATLAAKVYKKFERHSLAVVRENPYRLSQEISGIGFKRADEIASTMGFTQDHPFRVTSGILFALTEAQGEGHCYLPESELIQKSISLLGVCEEAVTSNIGTLIRETKLLHTYLSDSSEAGSISVYYSPRVYHAERYIEKRLKYMSSFLPLELNMSFDPHLTPEQKDAVKIALTSGLSVITGSAGTGKSTVISTIIRCLEANGLSYELCAPTGKASKRITEVTGREAKTIHRLIGFSEAIGARRDEQHPLECSYVIVDETSMVDDFVLSDLLKAIPSTGRLVLCGDYNQLPPVGIGLAFTSIINSGMCPVTKLTTIHRQKQHSTIISIANDVKEGKMPFIPPDASDAFFFKVENPVDIANKIVELATKRIPDRFGISFRNIQVISPMKRGPIGTENLNKALQQAFQKENLPSMKEFMLGDKVMQLSNNYLKGVFNGQTGIVVQIDAEEMKLYVQYEGLGTIPYEYTDLDELTLSYAMTVHRSMGSEFTAVIAPFHTSHFTMLRKDLIYTCLTRTRDLLVIVGTKKALAIGIKNDRKQKRYTGLFKIF